MPSIAENHFIDDKTEAEHGNSPSQIIICSHPPPPSVIPTDGTRWVLRCPSIHRPRVSPQSPTDSAIASVVRQPPPGHPPRSREELKFRGKPPPCCDVTTNGNPPLNHPIPDFSLDEAKTYLGHPRTPRAHPFPEMHCCTLRAGRVDRGEGMLLSLFRHWQASDASMD